MARAHAALAAGTLRVGFLGGSITAPKTGTRWPEAWLAWLGQWAPSVRAIVENAALGATGSDLAVFRAAPDILAHGCDLVFVEYAVNDVGQPPARRGRTREGLLRQLLAAGCDVVLVHTFCPEMQADMEAGRVPASIAEFEALAEHYGVGSVWAGLHGWEEVTQGLMTWAEWLPDGLHPESRGSLSYAQSVIAFCEKEWICTPETGPRSALLPALHPGCWDTVSQLPLEKPACSGPWTLRRWSTCLGMNRALHSTVPGAGLKFTFTGRGLVLGFDFGRLSGEVRYRVDGGAWQTTQRDRPAWAGDSGWFRPTMISDELVPGEHLCELESVSAPFAGGCGTVTTIGLIGVIH
ncbi:SGNH/GDSL hydrolase family protein [Lacunisphaera limnophila]|uniref:SGNH/GDSL hydrolase family protein n=1 Tax=Lacunisphaera limnophila TaxID=1838286 RepID=UPI000859A3CE|nr:SGNH/GDSL hydrolase family protein [Lacunisphaera limnophila]